MELQWFSLRNFGQSGLTVRSALLRKTPFSAGSCRFLLLLTYRAVILLCLRERGCFGRREYQSSG